MKNLKIKFMRKLLNDKDADEKYLSPWMFLVWAIIGLFIIGGVIIFYSAQGDVRTSEANILTSRVLDCIGEKFNYTELTNENFDIYEKCSFDKEILENSGFFYINITAKEIKTGNSEDLEKSKEIFKIGANFAVECGHQFDQIKNEKRQEKTFPQCAAKSLYAFDEQQNKNYILKVTAASDQK